MNTSASHQAFHFLVNEDMIVPELFKAFEAIHFLGQVDKDICLGNTSMRPPAKDWLHCVLSWTHNRTAS